MTPIGLEGHGHFFFTYFVQVVVPNPVDPEGEVWTWLEGCGVALAMLNIEILLVLSQLSFLIFRLKLHSEHFSAIVIYGEVNIIPVFSPIWTSGTSFSVWLVQNLWML